LIEFGLAYTILSIEPEYKTFLSETNSS